MNNILKSIFAFLLPFLSVWIVIIYLRCLNYINQNDILDNWILFILYLPVIFFDYKINNYLKKGKLKNKIYTLLWGQFFWFVLFLYWVIVMPELPRAHKWLEFFNFSVFANIKLVYVAEAYLSFIAFLIWLAAYGIITVKKGYLRIFVSVVLPVLFTYLLFMHFYFYGGLGHCKPDKIISQKGVKIFYSKEDFPKKDYQHYQVWTDSERFFPREIFIDKERNALYSNYANTYGKSSAKKTPNILKIDMKSKETFYYVDNYTRAISGHSNSILISPWYSEVIIELDKKDLKIARKIPLQHEIYPWELANIYHDVKGNAIYAANDMTPSLLKYDYTTGELKGSLQPGYFTYGGAFWDMAISDKTGLIYINGLGAKEDIFEIDSDTMEIKRKLDIVVYGGSAILLDDENDTLYFQDGDSWRLFEIDIKKMKVKRVFKSEIHSRKLFLDRKRGALYVLSFCYGKFFAIKLDNGKRAWTLRVGGKPSGLAVDQDTVFINSMAGIISIDLAEVWDDIKK